MSQILLDGVNCTGSEVDLFACPSMRGSSVTCSQTDNAGIECNGIRKKLTLFLHLEMYTLCTICCLYCHSSIIK